MGVTMKSTGIVRKIDDLGRVVLPKELRTTMHLNVKDAVEFFTEGDSIILKKYEPCCYFCGEGRDLIHFKGKLICHNCQVTIKTISICR